MKISYKFTLDIMFKFYSSPETHRVNDLIKFLRLCFDVSNNYEILRYLKTRCLLDLRRNPSVTFQRSCLLAGRQAGRHNGVKTISLCTTVTHLSTTGKHLISVYSINKYLESTVRHSRSLGTKTIHTHTQHTTNFSNIKHDIQTLICILNPTLPFNWTKYHGLHLVWLTLNAK